MKRTLLLISGFIVLNAHAQMTVTVGGTVLDVDTVYYGTGNSGAYTGNNGMDIPWEIIYGPDDHIWVTERKGLVSRINPVTKTKTIILDIMGPVGQFSESGLLGMVLHPDFATTPEVFMAYTYGSTASNLKEKVVKYTYNGTSLVNEVVLLDNIDGYSTHNGARLAILPDNTLIFTTGDAQDLNSPQNTGSLNGKVLRINLDGTIPGDNPIAGNPLYSFGHRNAQGILQHPNGKIYLSEHGADTDDEFQILEVNRNYGWPDVRGFCDDAGEMTFCTNNNVIEPLLAWTPTIAPSDMVYYENPLIPAFDGKILMTVLKDKKVIAIDLNADGTAVDAQVHYLTNQFGRLRDICVGPDKTIYLATNGASWSNTNPNTHSIIALRTQDFTAVQELYHHSVKIYPNPAVNEVTLEVNQDLVGAEFALYDLAGRKVLIGSISSASQKLDISSFEKGSYVLKITDLSGKVLSRQLTK
jgi:glucose/arabinose dehydrogenase